MINALNLFKALPMNTAQKAILSHKRGPLLVIAGPGSGKTRSLILLAMNLLLCGDAEPSQIVLCTYTEKAAYELQDRLASIARDVQYTMEVPCDKDEIEQVVASVDKLAEKIQQKDFDVKTPPMPSICQACDIRYFCKKEGFIR